MIKALFAVWGNNKSYLPAELFYQKMTTFGLATNNKAIENITNIMYGNRPKLKI